VIVGKIGRVKRWDSNPAGTAAFSFETTSCNIGDKPLDWNPRTVNHPVIAQGLYRLDRAGRFQQLGLSWLKHGFSVVPGNECGHCPADAPNDRLVPGCSDTYSAELNGQQFRLGPRSEVNPVTGQFIVQHARPTGPADLAGRLQVNLADLQPGTDSGAPLYFLEAQYIHPQDAAAGNGTDNASYRKALVSTGAGAVQLDPDPGDATHRRSPAIQAWQDNDHEVRLFAIDVPDDGRVIFGIRSTPLAGQGFHLEMAVQNLTSDRAVRSLTLSAPQGTMTNPGFHGVKYHSGEKQEKQSGKDWPVSVNNSRITWSVDQPQGVDPAEVNALRWGTLYNFWCDSSDPPTEVEVGFLKPGGQGAPASVRVPLPPATVRLAPPSPDVRGSWLTFVPTDVDLGAVTPGRAGTIRLFVRPGLKKRALTLDSSAKEVKVTRRDLNETSGLPGWEVKVEKAEGAADEPFETTLTLRSDDQSDQPVRLRVFGHFAAADGVKPKPPQD
jgi:hypothetical protein